METVFHDVPTPPVDYILDIERLRDSQIVVSRIRPEHILSLVDLSTKGLKRLGLQRSDLIDTPVKTYPDTRAWAAWLHLQSKKANGLQWTSRQDDEARALMLFGDRIAESAFSAEIVREPIFEGERLDTLLALAERIGIERVIGLA